MERLSGSAKVTLLTQRHGDTEAQRKHKKRMQFEFLSASLSLCDSVLNEAFAICARLVFCKLSFCQGSMAVVLAAADVFEVVLGRGGDELAGIRALGIGVD